MEPQMYLKLACLHPHQLRLSSNLHLLNYIIDFNPPSPDYTSQSLLNERNSTASTSIDTCNIDKIDRLDTKLY